MMSRDLSVVMSLRGSLQDAHPSLRAVFRSIEDARVRGQRTAEVLLLVDGRERSNGIAAEETAYLREHWKDAARIIPCESCDRGLQWRDGTREAAGDFVCLMDSHDHVSRGWLEDAIRCLQKFDGDAVAHPDLVLEFGALQRARRQLSSTEHSFPHDDLFMAPLWHSLSLAGKDLLLRFPYRATDLQDSFGSGDWDFACDTLVASVPHLIASRTSCFVRRHPEGMPEPWDALPIARPSSFFDAEPLATTAPVDDSARNRAPSRTARVLKAIYRPIYGTVKPIAKRHPRWNRLGIQIANAFREFARPSRSHESKDRFPEWFLEDWRRIHEVEPDLFPEEWLVRDWPLDNESPQNIKQHYQRLRAAIGTDVSHLVLVPWIRKGGADLTALNYLRALIDLEVRDSVVVLCTTDVASAWRDRVPDGVRFVEMEVEELAQHESEMLLARVLLQLRPRVVHNINSELAWQVFAHFGGALKKHSRLFASTFCTDLETTGRAVGYPVSYYRHCFEHLTAMFVDNTAHAEELVQRFAFDRSKMIVHYQPAPGTTADESRTQDGLDSPRLSRTREAELQILWAGRLDRQKRPDLLVAIAQACRNIPAHFHVYGASELDGGYDSLLQGLPNLTVHGAYDGFASLPLERFDVYLYTSEWDGLPNVLLEAATVGLPILAGDAGGISEFVEDENTGFLVTPYDNVDGFASRIEAIVQDRERLPVVAGRARDLVATRHTWKSFLDRVREAPNYVVEAPRENC